MDLVPRGFHLQESQRSPSQALVGSRPACYMSCVARNTVVNAFNDVCGTKAVTNDVVHTQASQRQHVIESLVVDSLSGGHNTNENETSAGKVVQAIAKIAGAVNKPILLAHHVNKMGFAPESPSMV